MNLLRAVFILLLAASFFPANAQSKLPDWEWRKWVNTNATVIAADKDDNFYICGLVNEEAFPPGVDSTVALHISKYDRKGKLIWAKGYGSGDIFYIRDMKMDDLGNIYLQGLYFGPSTFDTFVLNYMPNEFESFTAKIDAGGTVQWVRAQSAPGGNGYYVQMGLDAGGNTYTSGFYYGNMDLGSVQLNAGPDGDIYHVKYDASGNTSWARSYTLFPSTNAHNIVTTADADGNSYIMGNYEDSIRFGNTVINEIPWNNGTGYNCFLAKHDPAGNLVWTKNLSGVSPSSITTDNKGNVYATGNMGDSANLGAGTIVAGPGSRAFLAGINKDGNTFISSAIDFSEWPSWGVGSTLTTTGNGDIYVGGFFEEHGTIAKFDATGNMSWAFIDTLWQNKNYFVQMPGMCAGRSGSVYTITNWSTHFGDLDGTYIGKLGLFPADVENIASTGSKLKLYPNPASGSLTVISDKIPDGIQIYDISGKMVYNNTTTNTKQTIIDIQHLAAGIYLLRTGTDGASATFTKQ